MRVFLIRHGFAYHNLAALKVGDIAYSNPMYKDAKLTPIGINQAINAGNKLKCIYFNKIYSSPLIRCIQTCMLILSENKYFNNNKTIFLDDKLLEEQGKHICNERKSKFELNQYLSEEYINKFDMTNVKSNYLFDKESINELKNRIDKFMYNLSKNCNKNDNILIVTHYVWLFNYFEMITGIPYEFENTEIRVIYI